MFESFARNQHGTPDWGMIEADPYAYSSEISSQKGQAVTRKRWL